MALETGLCDLCFPFAMGELDETEALRFSRHLETCQRCQAEYEDLLAMRQDVVHAMSTNATYPTKPIAIGHGTPIWMLAFTVLFATIIAPHHPEFIGKLHETALDMRTGTVLVSRRLEHMGSEARSLFHPHLDIKKINLRSEIRGI
ncbi:MAG: zf-HC2 domain-containing protein [Alicyclobacillus sp.]|nr:zf-HC2 domain-containing protein [Alicyclobacillus sp.]